MHLQLNVCYPKSLIFLVGLFKTLKQWCVRLHSDSNIWNCSKSRWTSIIFSLIQNRWLHWHMWNMMYSLVQKGYTNHYDLKHEILTVFYISFFISIWKIIVIHYFKNEDHQNIKKQTTKSILLGSVYLSVKERLTMKKLFKESHRFLSTRNRKGISWWLC